MNSVNRNTLAAIETASQGNAHAVLLSGMAGAGKGYAARILCSMKLNLQGQDSLDKYPYFKHIRPKERKITIDQIREISKFFKLKSLGTAQIRRALILEDAHVMNMESQNALLKNLEEPPEDTLVVLTTTPTQSLKDTIRSRVQTLHVHPLTFDEASNMMGDDFTDNEKKKLYMMSGGLAGLLYSLILNKDHELLEEIDRAKSILNSSKFERLKQVEGLAKNKSNIPLFLQAMKIISLSALEHSANKQDVKTVIKWQKIASLAVETEKSLPSNPNPKLLLTNLMLKM